MQEQQAMDWHYAEQRQHEGEPTSWFELAEERREEIRKHVRILMDNEIPRSQMSAPDLAIFHGRQRQFGGEPPKACMERFREGATAFRSVFWDTLVLGPPIYDVEQRTRLFGYANIGNAALTNLQVSGQLASDQHFYVSNWHLSVLCDSKLAPELEALLMKTMVLLRVEERPYAFHRMLDLWREPKPVSVLLGVRQNFDVIVEFGHGFDFFEKLRNSDNIAPFGISLNLEGWQITGRLLDGGRGGPMMRGPVEPMMSGPVTGPSDG